MIYRVGIGYDIHRLVKKRKLILGGVELVYPKGLLGHSDADVLIHAICDAILGAMGKSDIGMLFPDTDFKNKGLSSVVILKETDRLMKQAGFRINNIDAVLILEEPKIYKHKNKILESLSGVLGVNKNIINIKAKTQEKLGLIGNKKAIATFAVALLVKEGQR